MLAATPFAAAQKTSFMLQLFICYPSLPSVRRTWNTACVLLCLATRKALVDYLRETFHTLCEAQPRDWSLIYGFSLYAQMVETASSIRRPVDTSYVSLNRT